jgi:hypothetical protein
MCAPSGIFCECGASYDEYRTGMSFAQVKELMWNASEDPRDWRWRGRRAVLGLWRELKLGFWAMEHEGCGEMVGS